LRIAADGQAHIFQVCPRPPAFLRDQASGDQVGFVFFPSRPKSCRLHDAGTDFVKNLRALTGQPRGPHNGRASPDRPWTGSTSTSKRFGLSKCRPRKKRKWRGLVNGK